MRQAAELLRCRCDVSLSLSSTLLCLALFPRLSSTPHPTRGRSTCSGRRFPIWIGRPTARVHLIWMLSSFYGLVRPTATTTTTTMYTSSQETFLTHISQRDGPREAKHTQYCFRGLPECVIREWWAKLLVCSSDSG